ncbi:putative T7SS-secreted protein [Streptomyces sp. ODS28]|uniref:putative T7SS-secreted protein n=1 Tax=Streptomyces sp. ODS28 TaxID=3136688 RepID=UPI0031F19216
MAWWNDIVPDQVSDALDEAGQKVGGAIEDGADATADWMDRHDWSKGASNWVREKGDSAGSALGAEVDEEELGQSEDPAKLIHGSPEKLRSTATHLKEFQKAFTQVARGLKGMDSEHLRGRAADAFREKVSIQPGRWHKAAEACGKAAGALEDFAGTVAWAQKQAKEAIARYKQGQSASSAHEEAASRYREAVEKAAKAGKSARAAAKDPHMPDKPADSDPGDAHRKAAREILREARRQRDEASDRAVRAVSAAREEAPPKPEFGDRYVSGLHGLRLASDHFAAGVFKGAAGTLAFVRSVVPYDPYNLTHPTEYATSLNSTLAGLVQSGSDPVGTGKQMWADFKKDPDEGFGRLLPDAIGAKGLGRLKGIARAGRAVEKHVPEPHKRPGHEQLENDGPEQHRDPDRQRDCDGTDPVDFATGRMFLPQTDVELPGALPLVFRRRVESGYRAGRWFGPSWASTVDQRLEISAAGIVLVTDGGLLLKYPHPAPGLPTLPVTGPRWPLERTPEGDYTLDHTDSGQTWHFTGPAGGGDGEAPLAEIEDGNGARLTFEYDAQGAPRAIVHSGGYHLKVATAGGRVAALSLAGAAEDGGDQELCRYGYDESGNLTGVRGAAGGVLGFAYDDQRRITAWVDSNDRRYEYAYDERHRCIAEGSPEGHVALRIDHDGHDAETGHRVVTATTGEGHVTRRLVDAAYKVRAVTDPLGHTTRSAYNGHGALAARTDALGRTVGFGYDEAGRLASVTRPDDSRITVGRNDIGLPTEVVEADGSVWRYAYDDRGNRTSATDPSGATTSYTYDASGHLTSVTDALGAVTRVRCDAAGLPVEITDAGGGVTSYARDAFGRPTAIVDPLGSVTRLVWTLEGRLARRIRPGGAEEAWEYDGEGNCVTYVDAAGGVTRYEYGHFDLLTAQTGPDGVRYAFTHDAELRLTRVTNPQGLTWDYAYDPAGRLVSETDFDDRTVRYEHDAAGQLRTRTTALGETIAFERDALGRIVRKDAAGAVTDFAYDPAGRLLSASGPDAEVVYQRDKLGRVKTELVNGRALAHGYDALGRPTRRVTPTGAVTTYAYDAAGNRTEVTAGGRSLSFEHDALGRETGRRVGDAVGLSQLWDPAGRLSELTVTGVGAGTVQHRSYTYRPDGYLTGIDDALNGPSRFTLDPAGRVTAVEARRWQESYAYDAAGNQTRASWPEKHASAEARGERVYAGTRIRSAGGVRYEHDAGGRMVLRQKSRLSKKPDTWRYEWDAEDRLVACTTPDGTVWRYRYDPLGRRIAKQRMNGDSIAEQIDFTWDGPTLIEQTTTGPELPDPVTLTWDHNGLQPLSQTERRLDSATQDEIDSRFYAIVTDLVGTPTELLDEQGEIAWRTRKTLWGTTVWNKNATAHTPLRFPGQYHDPETGLHYNVHRHYDPETARYVSPDPLGLEPAPNPASYVDNPHTWSDPLGLAPEGCPPHKTFPSRSAAFRGAKRDLGIPMGQQADEVSHVPMTDKWGKPVLDENKQPIQTREYSFTRGDGSKVVIQDHGAGHQYHEGGVGDQGPHFNVRPSENIRTGKVPGTAQHYEY